MPGQKDLLNLGMDARMNGFEKWTCVSFTTVSKESDDRPGSRKALVKSRQQGVNEILD